MSKLSILQLLVALIAITAPIDGYNGDEYYAPLYDNDTYFNQLILNIYVDKTGEQIGGKLLLFKT